LRRKQARDGLPMMTAVKTKPIPDTADAAPVAPDAGPSNTGNTSNTSKAGKRPKSTKKRTTGGSAPHCTWIGVPMDVASTLNNPSMLVASDIPGEDKSESVSIFNEINLIALTSFLVLLYLHERGEPRCLRSMPARVLRQLYSEPHIHECSAGDPGWFCLDMSSLPCQGRPTTGGQCVDALLCKSSSVLPFLF
jgi:hypothetical protein